ncbi:glycoside hydrolase family 97 protein [Streptomyces sp. CB03911]|uniref:glycoside hydrolase family 97 protein n=1 Tax=Streptomyces sp. CB03911 TaxID=1804758 RepID=UPI00093BCA01|nr:glycoside hydrolase family 97 protein [Streptomyces sp. CB03911]OKI12747.1 glycosyl hydrolase family 98 [Streptomyces sp. CB03911]
MQHTTRRDLTVAATLLALTAGLGATATGPASAATPGSWTSARPGAAPGGCDGVRATVALDAAGTPSLGATLDCKQVLNPAPIGLVTSSTDFSTGLDFVSRTDKTVDETYSTTTGNSRTRARTATETRLVFAKGSERITVHVRTSSDGLALRYELPGAATVLREATSFDLPADAQLTRESFSAAHEQLYSTSAVSATATGEYDMSLFGQLGNGARVLLSEAGVDGGYSGGRFTHTQGNGRFTVKLADAQVARTTAFRTPWRVAVIGDTATVVESTLEDDVAPASKVADTSWIRPGIAAWPWFDGTKATQRDLGKLKSWADYASSQGWPYLLVDDGWKGVTWMPDLVSYAQARGVKIMLWYHWQDLDTPAERDAEFTRLNQWGVVGVKMDFMGSESQARQQWYDDALADAAAHRLMVDLHGARLPVGVNRTWPHVLTSEAVRGEEYSTGRTLGHVTAVPFTRGALGGADYSPMSFQRSNPDSDGAELALGVLYESALMLPGGRVSDYQARPEAQRWMRELPTVWDESRFVQGDPVGGSVLARRNGDRWFVGAINGGGAGSIEYPTAFLGSGSWHAEITTDGPDGLVRTSRVIRAGDTLSVPAVAHGGHVVKLTRVAGLPAGNRTVKVAGGADAVAVDGAAGCGVPVVRAPGDGSGARSFELKPLGDGYLRIVNQGSGEDVVVLGASRNAGAKIVQCVYAAGEKTNDEWLAEDAGGGNVRFANRYSGLYLTAPATQGGQFEQRPYDGSGRQLFTVS